jgi:Protein of unknown function (DUF2934)
MAKAPRRKRADASATAADRGQKPIDTAITFSHNDIARRAYDLYLARGGEPGHQLEDWLQAERDLRDRSLPTVG